VVIAVVNGAVVNGEVVNGEVVNGEVVNGEVVNGEVVNGEVVNGEVVIEVVGAEVLFSYSQITAKVKLQSTLVQFPVVESSLTQVVFEEFTGLLESQAEKVKISPVIQVHSPLIIESLSPSQNEPAASEFTTDRSPDEVTVTKYPPLLVQFATAVFQLEGDTVNAS